MPHRQAAAVPGLMPTGGARAPWAIASGTAAMVVFAARMLAFRDGRVCLSGGSRGLSGRQRSGRSGELAGRNGERPVSRISGNRALVIGGLASCDSRLLVLHVFYAAGIAAEEAGAHMDAIDAFWFIMSDAEIAGMIIKDLALTFVFTLIGTLIQAFGLAKAVRRDKTIK